MHCTSAHATQYTNKRARCSKVVANKAKWLLDDPVLRTALRTDNSRSLLKVLIPHFRTVPSHSPRPPRVRPRHAERGLEAAKERRLRSSVPFVLRTVYSVPSPRRTKDDLEESSRRCCCQALLTGIVQVCLPTGDRRQVVCNISERSGTKEL